jgi:hypothetical protein
LELDLYVALQYSALQQQIFIGNIVSIATNLFQATAGLPVLPLVRGALGMSTIVGLILFFKPLLTGIARALVLTVRPRLSKDERAARNLMRNAQLFQRMINASQDPSQAAELRALASRA